jgi:hypothetical protein
MFILAGGGYMCDERKDLLDTSQEICFMEISNVDEIKLPISHIPDPVKTQ